MKPICFPEATDVFLTPVAKLQGAQDGAFWNGYLFHLDADGCCRVYSFEKASPVASFYLDQKERIIPHSNAVFFGKEYFQENDPFPLLYTNIYNNYAKETDRRLGECLVYRIRKTKDGFSTQLLQSIRIGFTDTDLWQSEYRADIRPYGNFAYDATTDRLVAFVMRDQTHTTRCFTFPMPKITDGTPDAYGVKQVILREEELCDHFDTAYMNFMQGAACHNGYLYSVEGFYNDKDHAPALRIIDLQQKKQVLAVDLLQKGYLAEPECIDVYQGQTYYVDGDGTWYQVEFCRSDD